jgi:hypothetical protein
MLFNQLPVHIFEATSGLGSSGVLEFCAKSELHPVRGLGMLKGRQDRCSTRVRFSKTRLHENLAPIQGASLCGCGLGVKTPGLVQSLLRGMRLTLSSNLQLGPIDRHLDNEPISALLMRNRSLDG